MKISQKGLELLKKWEGCILKQYPDQAGLPTIGIGHLLTKSELTSGKIFIKGAPVKYANGISKEQALDLLDQDLDPAEGAVNDGVIVELTQDQFDALVSFVFNCGTGAFHGSTLRKELNQGLYANVPFQLRRWNRAGGKVCDGLIVRRRQEIRLWNGEI